MILSIVILLVLFLPIVILPLVIQTSFSEREMDDMGICPTGCDLVHAHK